MANWKFPDKPEDCEMSDEEWIEYCIGTWCCNSLNERIASNWHEYNHNHCNQSEWAMISTKQLHLNAIMFERAQFVINYLYDENKKLKKMLETKNQDKLS